MYLIVPLSLIAISVIGIAIIIWKKTPYLKKIDVESMAGSGSTAFSWAEFFKDLAPEIVEQKPKLKNFKELWLSELEKVIRRLRLVSMKMDRFSEGMIKKIRKSNRKQPGVVSQPENVVKEMPIVLEPLDKVISPDPVAIKQKEQDLIMKIAKDPKNPDLFLELGQVYISMKQWSDAKESLEAVLELKGEDEEIKKQLSLVLEKIKLSSDTK